MTYRNIRKGQTLWKLNKEGEVGQRLVNFISFPVKKFEINKQNACGAER